MIKHQQHIILSLLALVISNYALGQHVLINEVQYQNKTTINCTDGSSPDWIELYNNSNKIIQLEGFQLSDDDDLIDCWTFPDVEIAPNNFLLVYASGEDKFEEGELHTDFRLSVMKDPLYLLNTNGDIIDEVTVQCIPPDKSLGRHPNGSNNRVIQHPSPGTSNNNSQTVEINFIADTLIVSKQSGFYESGITIELYNSNNLNNIVYSLDGDVPDYDSPEYGSPISLTDISGNDNRFANKGDVGYEPGNLISKANILRARVYSEGCPASNEISNTYFISNTQAFNYEVPVVSIITEDDNLFDDEIGIYTAGNNSNYGQHGKDWERPIHIEMYQGKKQIINQDAGVRIHGRGSRSAPQKSLRLYARDEYGTGEFNFPFFSQKPELNTFKTLLLRSTRGWSGSLFKDELCQKLVQNMNMDYTAVQTTVLFINGEYWGVYSLRERHDEHYVGNNYNVENPELDIIGYDKSSALIEAGDEIAYYQFINFLENSNPESQDFYQEVADKIDVQATIDFFIAQLYLANSDFPNNNLELWKFRNDTSKWRFFFFDLDAAMIRTNYNHLSEYNNTNEDLQRFEQHSMLILRKLLNNSEFRQIFNASFYKHLNSTFSPATVISAINYYKEIYEPLVAEQCYRWGNPTDYNKWLHNVDMLEVFAMERPVVIHEQLAENFGNPFNVYPNPSYGKFNIDFLGNDAYKTVSIYNMLGQAIYSENFQNTTAYIDNPFKNGMYLMRIDIEGNSYTQLINIVK